MTEQPEQSQTEQEQPGYIDPAGLMFQGRVVIKDVETGEVLVDKRSE
jgi:hypothetical protein